MLSDYGQVGLSAWTGLGLWIEPQNSSNRDEGLWGLEVRRAITESLPVAVASLAASGTFMKALLDHIKSSHG